MSNWMSVLKKIKIMLDRINKIYEICEEYGGVEYALQNDSIGQLGIMKCFDIIQEQIKKLENYELPREFISEFHLMGLNYIRNLSSHNYHELDFNIIESTIKEDLPDLENELRAIMDKITSQECLDDTSFDKDDKESKMKKLDKQIQGYEKLAARFNKRISEIKAEREELADSIQKPKGPKR